MAEKATETVEQKHVGAARRSPAGPVRVFIPEEVDQGHSLSLCHASSILHCCSLQLNETISCILLLLFLSEVPRG